MHRAKPLHFLAAALSLACTGIAFAHPGGLNAEGCHNNRKTGDYHCHRAARADPPPSALRAAPAARTAGKVDIGRAFRNCTEARAMGAAPVMRGDPGYGPHLDRDNDGIGCESYRGR